MRPMWGALYGGSITWRPVSTGSGGRDGGGGGVEGSRGRGVCGEGRGGQGSARRGAGEGDGEGGGGRGKESRGRRPEHGGHPPGDVAAPSCLSRSGPSGLSRRMLIDAPNSSSLKAC